ncbi:conserved hypothetical protein [Desulfotalea psychrophila LSv54]|uniref:THIF-type NAD/FAD binding fold domain-containing protein n=1 Tax=Desulfotalea psychrophila (strain LSv54 / DSM 12343) TaxID=177439 RepID=Q6AS09_DESPS|nr:conserved hypothetical protein [Desulfotalea psychrophila LSv54]
MNKPGKMDRFSRLKALIGEKRVERLAARSVTIVGIGAVGGHAMEGLARSGIGHLRLVDFDRIDPSNINRQLLALDSTVGRLKVELAQERIYQINPQCKVEILPLFANQESIDKILDPKPDLLIDAIDALNPKTCLLEAAFRHKIPTISSMGAALRTDPTKITYGDIFDTRGCPLAKQLRKRLRNRGIGEGIFCVYSHEAVNFNYGNEGADEPNDKSLGRSRNILGSTPTIPAIFGLTIANQAIFALAEKEISFS